MPTSKGWAFLYPYAPMLNMIRTFAALLLLSPYHLQASNQKAEPHPSYDYQTAIKHEIEPHRRIIPVEGANPGFNQLRLDLTISATGEVISV